MNRRERTRPLGGRRTIVIWATIATVVLAGATITGIAVAATSRPEAPVVPGESSSWSALPERPITPSATATPAAVPPDAVSPAHASCDTRTTMSVWAHYDDDLIFMNPAVADAIKGGDCVRTVFLTAGDAGKGRAYASGREIGILRAYNDMRGETGFWSDRTVTLLSGMDATLWTPDDDPKVSLTFLHLPDGFLDGSGFGVTGHESLAKLLDGKIPTIAPIDGGAAVTTATLVSSIAELITAYAPAQLMTHVPGTVPALSKGDHSDHATTGILVRDAAQQIGYPLSQLFYVVGYPSEKLPANVSGEQLHEKVETFQKYAANDPVVACADYKSCIEKRRFGDWLQRHYVHTDSELFPGG